MVKYTELVNFDCFDFRYISKLKLSLKDSQKSNNICD